MGKKVRVRRTPEATTPSIPTPVLLDEWEANGSVMKVGDLLLVKHYSSATWVEAILKRITQVGEAPPAFHFYLDTPGSISVPLDRVRSKQQKSIRIKKSHKG